MSSSDPGHAGQASDAVDPRWIERVLLSRPLVGEVRVVCVDATSFRPTRLPDSVMLEVD